MRDSGPVDARSQMIERLTVSGRDLPLVYGTVMVVDRDGHLDWEVVVQTRDEEPVARTHHDLELRVLAGVDTSGQVVTTCLSGRAFFVRAVERVVVFRGDGPLAGIDPNPTSAP